MADTAPDELRKRYIGNYDELNKLGQVEAVIRTKELTRLSEYTDRDSSAEPTPQSPPASAKDTDTPTDQDTPEGAGEGE